MGESPGYSSRLHREEDRVLGRVEPIVYGKGLGYDQEAPHYYVANEANIGTGTILSQMAFHDPTFQTNPNKALRDARKPVSTDDFHRMFEDDAKVKEWKEWKAVTDSRAVERFKALTHVKSQGAHAVQGAHKETNEVRRVPHFHLQGSHESDGSTRGGWTPERGGHPKFPVGDIIEVTPGGHSVERRNGPTYDSTHDAKLTGLDHHHGLERTSSPNVDALVKTDEKRQYSIKRREERHAEESAAAQFAREKNEESHEITDGLLFGKTRSPSKDVTSATPLKLEQSD
jgi:hypothetical protein